MRPHKLLAAMFIIPALVAGCSEEEPCEVRPTSMVTQADGTVACIEADGEPCDDDPCDEEGGHTKPKKKTTRKR